MNDDRLELLRRVHGTLCAVQACVHQEDLDGAAAASEELGRLIEALGPGPLQGAAAALASTLTIETVRARRLVESAQREVSRQGEQLRAERATTRAYRQTGPGGVLREMSA